MTFVGYKRLRVQPWDKDGNPLCPQIVLQGDKDKGATKTAEISGLAKDSVKVSGSNIAYYTSRKGVGDVKIDFGILDFPEKESDIVLGYKVDNDTGIAYIGNDTEAPFCSVMLESENIQGDIALLSVFSGTFTKEKISLKTEEVDKAFEPEEESYSFSAVSDQKAGPQNGQYIGKYFGSKPESIKALMDQTFGTESTTTVPVTGITLESTPTEVKVGETFTVKTTVTPSNATDSTYTLASSDSKIATITPVAGKGTAVAPGKVTITGTTTDGNKTGTVEVTVVAAG
ncbi:major tail protein [Latilactobacillus curvatus]|uniref:major tail protein n=1 Tax=Latilactobacillus curvatus TaxID=28038 RepID=UPI00280BBDD8|nr:major tail protein [Latilactobacillus curvatus]